MNQKDLLISAENTLKKFNINDAYIKSKRLLEYVLNQKDSQLIINSLKEVSQNKKTEYEAKIQEIINGRPLQYITNSQEFMGLNFFVDENVLIPQPDTETLVETAIKKMKSDNNNKNKPIQILDLCTGSGCIAISIAKFIKNSKIVATDISEKALQVAKKNAVLNNVESKIEFICSNLFENIEKQQFDYILSNPPYIETSDINNLSEDVKKEPYIALNGGEDGLKFYKEILQNAYKYLLTNGYLIIEIGYSQAEKTINICAQNLNLETKTPIKDLAGNDRVLIFKKSR